MESAATPTSHTVPFNGRLHQQFETVFKCLLEIADQRTETKKPPKMKVMGHNVGSSSEEDDDEDEDDDSSELPPPKGRGGVKRRKTAACLCGGEGGGCGGAAVKAEEPIELLSSSQDS